MIEPRLEPWLFNVAAAFPRPKFAGAAAWVTLIGSLQCGGRVSATEISAWEARTLYLAVLQCGGRVSATEICAVAGYWETRQ